MTQEPTWNRVFVSCLERYEDEGQVALASFCEAYPEFADKLRKRIGELNRLGFLGESSPAPSQPKRLGDFLLGRRLGGGGMGVVYMATQSSLERPVALKMIRPDLSFSDQVRSRFHREASILASLTHVNIVPIHDYGEDGQVPFFAMEYVEGKTFAEIIQAVEHRNVRELTAQDLFHAIGYVARDPSHPFDQSITWHEACLRLVLQAVAAIEHAHEKEVLHRDIKPSNLMVTPSARVMLFDFGLAMAQNNTRMTRTGTLMGSLPYMSPEQALGQPMTEASDTYSLGVTLIELLTLNNPFQREDIESTRAMILSSDRPSPRDRNPNLPFDVATICLAAIDPDPARRYSSARAFASDIENVLSMRPIQARPVSFALRTKRWIQRHQAKSVGILLGTLLLISIPTVTILTQFNANKRIEEKAYQLKQKNEQLATALRETHEALNIAAGSIEEALEQLADFKLRNIPGTTRIREALLSTARSKANALAAMQPEDPNLRFILARLISSQGLLLSGLGRLDEARATYDEAIAIYDGIEDIDSTHFRAASQRARLYSNYALAEANRGETDRAIELIERAMDINALQRERHPHHLEHHYDSLLSFANFIQWKGRTDPEKALRHSGEALQMARELCSKDDRLDHVYALVGIVAVRAALQSRLGMVRDSIASYDEAFHKCQRVVASHPEEVRYLAELQNVSANYGTLLRWHDRFEEALTVLQAARHTGETLLRLIPEHVTYQIVQAVICQSLGLTQNANERNEEARENYLKSRDLLEGLLAGTNTPAEVYLHLSSAHSILATHDLSFGRLEQTKTHATKAIRIADEGLAVAPLRDMKIQATSARIALCRLHIARLDFESFKSLAQEVRVESGNESRLLTLQAEMWSEAAEAALGALDQDPDEYCRIAVELIASLFESNTFTLEEILEDERFLIATEHESFADAVEH